jgi:putative phosphoribosyl transferase
MKRPSLERMQSHPLSSSPVALAVDGRRLDGDLTIPAGALALVEFAHGSGSSRLSPRNRHVAATLNERGLATLLFDLLTEDEAADRSKVFDVELLARRLLSVTSWARADPRLTDLGIGYFGASTGAAAALIAAAEEPAWAGAVVSRGGRPDLAAKWLPSVRAPTLLIVGGADVDVLRLNREALEVQAPGALEVVPGATHLFEEPGALEQVADLSARWFEQHLAPG